MVAILGADVLSQYDEDVKAMFKIADDLVL